MKRWCGTPPKHCDLYGVTFPNSFIDGKTKMGPWANLCTSCYATQGVRLGTGRGQLYVRQPDGSFLKVEG